MSDMGDDFRYWRELKKEKRKKFGIMRPQCAIVRPKAHPSILLPGQKCKVDGYVAPNRSAAMERSK